MADATQDSESPFVSEATLKLGGFVLAHAVWSVSDTDADELLCPLAVVERHGERELLRFEAETQEEAIRSGKKYLSNDASDTYAWAFAREGLLNEHGFRRDVIAVDLMAKGQEKSVSVIQRFRRACEGIGFQLIGRPTIVVDGYSQGSEVAEELLRSVRDGIAEHGSVGPLWSTWNGW